MPAAKHLTPLVGHVSTGPVWQELSSCDADWLGAVILRLQLDHFVQASQIEAPLQVAGN